MKKVILSILFIGGLFATSCSSDPCKDQTATTKCSGKGTLVASGSNCDCNCNQGSTGSDCSLSIIGVYTASNDVLGTSTSITPYTSSLSLSSSTVIITSFKNAFFKNVTTGTLSGNTINIPSQEPDNDGYKIAGTGTISYTGTKVNIKWSYSITGKNAAGTTVTDNINGTWTK